MFDFILSNIRLGAIVDDPKVSFNDIVGLEQAKQTLKEAVIMPIRFPKLFEGSFFLMNVFLFH